MVYKTSINPKKQGKSLNNNQLYYSLILLFPILLQLKQSHKMPPLSHLLLLLTALITLSAAEEWYMPDSNLISDAEFNSKIVEDKHSFKFVKYFTPHCPYCRYLKNVMDPLKHKKQWCFKVYDFNCQWYPQFCMNHVRSGSFPYTAIYDQNGDMVEEIHGFYPEPIISNIFDRIEERCLAARGQAAPLPPQSETVVQQAIAHHQANMENNVKPAVVEPVQFHQQPEVQTQQKSTQQKKTDIKEHSQSQSQPHVQAENQKENKLNAEEVKLQPQQIHATQQHSQQSNQKLIQKAKQAEKRALHEKEVKNAGQNQGEAAITFHSYLFYGVCLLCAAYYIYSLHADKPNPETKQIHTPKTASKIQQQKTTQPKQSQQVEQQPCMQQSELLKQIPDEEL